jgi:hypothetical protein
VTTLDDFGRLLTTAPRARRRGPKKFRFLFKWLQTLRQRNEELLEIVSDQGVGRRSDDFGRLLTTVSMLVAIPFISMA